MEDKKIIFLTDCIESPNINARGFDSTKRMIESGYGFIVTTSIANMSFDLLELGYRIFLGKPDKNLEWFKIIELKPGMDNVANKDIRRPHNILKMFIAGFFDEDLENSDTYFPG